MSRLLTGFCWPLLLLLAGTWFPANGAEVAPADFAAEILGMGKATPALCWLKGETGEAVKKILGHAYAQQRVRYWTDGKRTVWVLDEIGKERPITAGFVVENGAIAQMRVLAYRETRGGEISNPFFAERLKGRKLEGDLKLDRRVDGISGATLSVRAMTRLARMALYLDGVERGAQTASGGAL